VFHGRRQVGDDVGQAAAQGLGQQQRRPDHQGVEEQIPRDARLRLLFQ
jgi:hypothetical protein